MLEFVDYGLYFVQDENNFTNPLLQIRISWKKYRIRIRRAKNQRIRPDSDPHPCMCIVYTNIRSAAGCGMYQHDVSQTKLNATLDDIVVECVRLPLSIYFI